MFLLKTLIIKSIALTSAVVLLPMQKSWSVITRIKSDEAESSESAKRGGARKYLADITWETTAQSALVEPNDQDWILFSKN